MRILSACRDDAQTGRLFIKMSEVASLIDTAVCYGCPNHMFENLKAFRIVMVETIGVVDDLNDIQYGGLINVGLAHIDDMFHVPHVFQRTRRPLGVMDVMDNKCMRFRSMSRIDIVVGSV
ncbi:hypothetical protein KDA14_03330 [Candidatus Saccharibacteria bacterium]|nr:hypothetical protein [Candidatus Saccharibacteria bacterium]